MKKALIWLGAGRVETPSVNFDKFDAIALVEARLEQVEELRKQFIHDDKVKIVHEVVSDKAQKSDFRRYSLDEYSALTSITGLIELYPGLKLVEREEVNTQFVVDLLNDCVDQAFSISFMLAMGDLSAIALFGSQDFRTLPLYLFQLLGSYQMEAAAVVSVTLLLLSVGSFSLIEFLFTRSSKLKS